MQAHEAGSCAERGESVTDSGACCHLAAANADVNQPQLTTMIRTSDVLDMAVKGRIEQFKLHLGTKQVRAVIRGNISVIS